MVALPSDPITTMDLVHRWGISKQAVHKWIKKARFTTWRAGRTLVMSEREVDRFVTRLKAAGDLAPGEHKQRRKK